MTPNSYDRARIASVCAVVLLAACGTSGLAPIHDSERLATTAVPNVEPTGGSISSLPAYRSRVLAPHALTKLFRSRFAEADFVAWETTLEDLLPKTRINFVNGPLSG